MADFFARIDALEKLVGKGTLSAVVGVDGGARSIPLELAAWQDFMGRYGPKAMNINEPGEPHAVQKSLTQTHELSYEDIAKTVLVQGPQKGMERAVERINSRFQEIAPIDTGQYRQSTRRIVLDGETPVYDRQGPFYGEEPSS